MSKTLKEVLGDLFTSEVETKLGNSQVYVWDKDKPDTEPIPKFRVGEMTESLKAKTVTFETQIKSLEETISQRDRDLKDLKKSAEGNAELIKQIDDLQKASKEAKENFEKEKESFTKQEAKLKKTLILKEHLLNAQVFDADARELLTKNFDVDKLDISEDGKIKGFDDLLKPIKENKAFAAMFGKEIIAGQQHNHGHVDNEEVFTREQLAGMSSEYILQNNLLEKVNKSVAAMG
jgi:hypothetical protein